MVRTAKVVGGNTLGLVPMETPHMVNIVEDSGTQDFRGDGPRSISRTDPQVTSVIPKKQTRTLKASTF